MMSNSERRSPKTPFTAQQWEVVGDAKSVRLQYRRTSYFQDFPKSDQILLS